MAITLGVADRACGEPSGPDEPLFGRPLSAWRSDTRRELGLAEDRPLLVTGHQPGAWHAGILAKHALLAAAADRGILTHDLLVEHEAVDPLTVEVPEPQPDGRLRVRRHRLGAVPPGRVAGSIPAVPVAAPDGGSGTGPAVAAWGAALDAARAGGAESLSEQARLAIAELAPDRARPPAWSGSIALLGTAAGRAFVAEMVRDPWACASTYARAVRATPEAGIRPLRVREDFVELPLWRIEPDGRRRACDDVDAAAWLAGDARLAGVRLAPRALLLTAIARTVFADAFVHGRGGAIYDHAMERWIDEWLGVRPVPSIICSADVRLGPAIARDGATGERDRLVAAAHRTWHDPEPPLGSSGVRSAAPGPIKRELLAEIDRRPRGSEARRAAYRALHRQLAALRGVHGGHVESTRRRARNAFDSAERSAIMARRDWFFPVVGAERLDEMISAIRDAAGPVLAEVGVLRSGA